MDFQQFKSAALAKRNAGDFAGAEAMFRHALATVPDDVDSAHMLGVLCFRTGRVREAVQFFLRAGMLSGWKVSAITRNFGLALSQLHGDAIAIKRIAYQTWLSARRRAAKNVSPLVTVLVPSYNHRAYVESCLQSVYRQTWRQIELIVIDDGSTDGSAELIRATLAASPFPYRFIARENRGAHATINEGIALAAGEYVNILNSDDRFHPRRIECLVQQVAAVDADWGFTGVDIIDEHDSIPVQGEDSLASRLRNIAANAEASPTIGFALLRHNVAISTGNLFVRTAFFNRIGGFSDLRYVHDQEFALRATLHAEPVYVAENLYSYRVHGNNTITEATSRAVAETAGLLDRHIQLLFGDDCVANPFAPTRANWGEYVAAFVLRYGFGGLLSGEQLAGIAARYAVATDDSGKPLPLTSLRELDGVAQAYPLLESMMAAPQKEMTFDQSQRYGITARVIECLRRKKSWGETFSILEVGANTHRLLGKLLPDDRITYLDREIPVEMQNASDIIVGDATNLDISDDAFDIVIALDVFEHIAQPDRARFLHHIQRVSRVATILAAPFDSVSVRDAERDASTYWEGLFSKPYRWLAEHAENGLPDLESTLAWLSRASLYVTHFGHGDLGLWCEMLKAHFAAEASAELHGPIAALDRHYCDHLLLQDFRATDAYRQFLLCSRNADVGEALAAFRDVDLPKTTSPDLRPFFDALQAMQYIAKHRIVLG